VVAEEQSDRMKRCEICERAEFGELVYASARPSAGVIFVKFQRHMRHAKPAAVLEPMVQLGKRLSSGCAVVEPDRVRVGKRPQSQGPPQ
jgi:hypothetical protein